MPIISLIFDLAVWLFILRVFTDFIPPLKDNAFGRFIHSATEPLMSKVRHLLPPISFGDTLVDVSALIIVLIIQLVQSVI